MHTSAVHSLAHRAAPPLRPLQTHTHTRTQMTVIKFTSFSRRRRRRKRRRRSGFLFNSSSSSRLEFPIDWWNESKRSIVWWNTDRDPTQRDSCENLTLLFLHVVSPSFFLSFCLDITLQGRNVKSIINNRKHHLCTIVSFTRFFTPLPLELLPPPRPPPLERDQNALCRVSI